MPRADSHEIECKQCAHTMNTVRSCFAAIVAFLVFAIGWWAADAAVCCDSSWVKTERGRIVAYCRNKNRTFHTVEAIGDSACDDNQTAWPVRNCCPPGELYDPEARICIPATVDGDKYRRRMSQLLRDAFPAAADAVMVGYDYEEPLCDATQVLVDVPTVEVRVLMKADPSAVELPPGYCFDLTPSDELVVQTCRPRNQYCGRDNYTCINKCCSRHKIYVYDNKENLWRCKKSKTPFTISVYETDSEGRPMGRGRSNITVLPYTYKLGKIVEPFDRFILTTDGLYLTDEGLLVTDNDKFCMEYLAKAGSPVAATLKAVVCRDAIDKTLVKWIKLFYRAVEVVSIVCFALTLVVYATLSYLRNIQGYYVMFYVVCELVMRVSVIALELTSKYRKGHTCVLFGYFSLFSMLTIFCWLNVISFDIYWILRYNNSINRNTSISVRTIMYHIYGWGLPSVCVSTGYLFQHSQHKTLRKLSPRIDCNLNAMYGYGFYVFYLIPVSVMLTANLILFLLTAIHCSRIKSELNKFNQTDSKTESFLVYKKRFIMSIKLFLITGIPYLSLTLAAFFKFYGIIHNIFYGIPQLQGVFVFIVFAIKRKVIMDIRKKFRGGKEFMDRRESTTPNTISGSS